MYSSCRAMRPPPMEWLGGAAAPWLQIPPTPPKLTPYWEMLLLMLLLPLWWFGGCGRHRVHLYGKPVFLVILVLWASILASYNCLADNFAENLRARGRRFNAWETNCRLKLLCNFSSLDFIVLSFCGTLLSCNFFLGLQITFNAARNFEICLCHPTSCQVFL